MSFTVDSSTARITQMNVSYAADGTVTITFVEAEVSRSDGTVDRTVGHVANTVVPAGAMKTSLTNLAASALTLVKTAQRWT